MKPAINSELWVLAFEHYRTPWWQWRKARKLRRMIHEQWTGGNRVETPSTAPAGEENEVVFLDEWRDRG